MTTATKRKTLSWTISSADMERIRKIVDRADDLWARNGREPIDQLVMDLHACHANGCPLDLAKLLAAPDADFAHDIAGIHRHLDRKTGELGGCFLPRCAS